ncbi:MAG: hypothetical protein ACKOFA_03360 [Rhodoluna sp.]
MSKKSKSTVKKIAIFAMTSGIALFSMSPAFAAGTSDYGIWAEPSFDAGTSTYSGGITFVGTTIPAATYSSVFSAAGDGNRIEVVDSAEEWISEGTPFGAVFGASGASTTNNFLKLGVARTDAPYITSTTTITFTSPVPADSLGIAIGDVDIDQVTISAKTAADVALTGDELVGSADPVGFNLCDTDVNKPTICDDVTDPTDVPVVTKNANDVVLRNSDVGEDVGVSAWLKPSAELSTLTIVHSGAGATSTVRVWLAGPMVEGDSNSGGTDELADTGASDSNLLPFAIALTLFGALSIAYARRLRRD